MAGIAAGGDPGTVLPCRCCGAAGGRVRFSAPGFDDARARWRLVECGSCGALRTDPAPAPERLATHYGAGYFGGAGAKFHPLAEGRVRRENAARAARLLERVPAAARSHARVLDVGCGRGLLVRALRARGADAAGTELPEVLRHLGPLDFPVHAGELETLGLPARSFDAVSIWHVLEHTRDPAATVGEIARLLAPGGVLAVAVPNAASLQARLFGPRWFHLDLPRHLFHFTPRALESLLDRAGFAIESRSTFSPGQNLFGFVQSALNSMVPAAPNRLYALLHAGGAPGAAARLELAAWLVPALALAPFALLELALSAAAGAGATLVVYARRRPAGGES